MNGNKLRSLRESKKMLQKQLADRLNLRTSTIGMYEQGRREPDNETLKKIANFFNVSTDFLLDNTKENKSEKEAIEKEALKNALVKAGFIKQNENLSEQELKNLFNFININKDYIKNKKSS